MQITQNDFDKIIEFIQKTCLEFNIDNGHGLDHSKQIFNYCQYLMDFYNLTNQQKLTIEISALLHDMCDKKYMNESEGIIRIEDFLQDTLQIPKLQIGDIETIILIMSYSKVLKNGYPDFTYMEDIELPYHIVRNADLLCAYDLERCMEYQKRCGGNRKECLEKMIEIYKNRVSRHITDRFINLEPAIEIAKQLEVPCKKSFDEFLKEYEKLI